MAKKSTTTRKSTSARKSTKSTRPKGGTRSKKGAPKKSPSPVLSIQLLKIFSGLTILIMIVLGVGIFADLFIKERSGLNNGTAAVRPREQRHKVQAPRPYPEKPTVAKPEKTVTKPKQPVFEVFSPESKPAVKPLAPLKTIPGDRPPMVAIILDDVGYDRHIADRFMGLDVPLTFSMLPYGTYSLKINDKAHARGFETMLHLPMEPNEYPRVNPGRGGLLTSMSPDELLAQLDRNLSQFTGLKGVNNHMGSRISTSPAQMRQIFSALKKRGLYYVDSRTTAASVARMSAEKFQLPFAERDIFIDHYEDEAFIRAQLQRLVRRAQEQGYAIGIAHPHEVTYQTLKAFLPRLKEETAIVPASTIVQQVMIAKNDSAHAKR